jgi:serine/threonine-protein kinase
MAKAKLLALLTRDHRALAEQEAAAGHKDKAAQLYLRAGDFDHAARLAAEIGDERLAVEAALRATLGAVPDGYAAAGAQQAAELLAVKGHHREAGELFELARAWRQAAETALKLHQPARAARLYERGRLFGDAAIYYSRAGLAEDELRVLKLESDRLREGGGRGRRGELQAAHADPALQRIDLRRAELLRRLGKRAESASLLREAAPTAQTGRLLEQAGQHEQAVNAYLASGELDEAVRLLGSQPGIDRRLAAEVYLRAGQPLTAAHLLATLGLSREAAEAYEAGGDWGRAGSRWEAAQDQDRAAHAYLRSGRTRDAGRCFGAAGKPHLAAASYAKAGDRAAAAEQFLRAGQPLAAARELLAMGGAGDKAAAAKLLLAIPASSADHEAGTLLLVPLLLEQGLRDDALRRLRALPPTSAASAAVAAVSGATGVPGVLGVPPSAPSQLAVGQLLTERYEILAELGRGGMGRVYQAFDREVGEPVAIKTLLGLPDEDSGNDAERLLRELQICRKITHPNVVRVFDLGRFDGGIFLTMELLEGERLDQRLARLGPLPPPLARHFLCEVAAGLGEAHSLGIVHRDLKPSNVFLTPLRLKILDFGIARRLDGDTRLTATGFAVGSPAYMSPEQLQGLPLDGRSDLYAMGVLAFTLLSGREPFAGATAAALALQHLQQAPPDLRRVRPDLPAGWPELVARLLAKQPADRFPSAAAVGEALSALPVST